MVFFLFIKFIFEVPIIGNGMLITNFGQSIHSPSDLIRDGYEYNKFCYVIIYKVIVINKKTKKGPKLKKVNISSETRCHNSDLRLTKEVF